MLLKKKVVGLSVYEDWFEDEIMKAKNSFLLYQYIDCTVETKNPFFIKRQQYTIVNNLEGNLDGIFSSFKKISRNCINKISKREAVTYRFNSITDEEFRIFYNEFAKQKNFPMMHDSLLSNFNGNVLYVSGYIDNELSNIHVYIFDNDKKIARFMHSVSTIHGIDDSAKRNLIGCINRYLYWQTIVYFHKKGYLAMDMGGYSNDENDKAKAGINQYKKSFSGEIIKIFYYQSLPFYILSKIKSLFK